ncbi:DNA cytosine methyltransferase [Polycladomyces zharkentensis]|nr:DNA cytosine methyltransferase [Polycladomyces sp. WAk]
MLDLFSGIGGFSLAAHWAGIKTVAFCEIDPYCRQVLSRHWPQVPIYKDVREITRERLEKDGVIDDDRTIGLICGGPPCQPFSVAGKKRGINDERHLWPEMYRIVRELRPPWVLIENVVGFVKLALDLIIDDLENEDYETRTFIIPACAVGAPHRRDRVWIVAHTSRELSHRSRQTRQGWPEYPDGGETVADTKSERWEKFNSPTVNERLGLDPGSGDQERSFRQTQRRMGRSTDGLSDWLDGHRWPAAFGSVQHDWEPPRVATGVTNRVPRLKALGNAIVPQVAYQILRAIREATEKDA